MRNAQTRTRVWIADAMRRMDASAPQTRANKWIKQESDQEGVMDDEKWDFGGR